MYDTVGRRKSVGSLPAGNPLVDMGVRLLESLPNPVVTRDELALAKCPDAATKGALTFQDLGIVPYAFESKAYNFLYRYQRGGHFVELRNVESQVGPAHVSHLVGQPKKAEKLN